jgi:hypothetical protein
METKFHGNGIIEYVDDDVLIKDPDDVFELFFTNDCSAIIIRKENLTNDFFKLSTGIANED